MYSNSSTFVHEYYSSFFNFFQCIYKIHVNVYREDLNLDDEENYCGGEDIDDMNEESSSEELSGDEEDVYEDDSKFT